jgi:hypothetical protein
VASASSTAAVRARRAQASTESFESLMASA